MERIIKVFANPPNPVLPFPKNGDEWLYILLLAGQWFRYVIQQIQQRIQQIPEQKKIAPFPTKHKFLRTHIIQSQIQVNPERDQPDSVNNNINMETIYLDLGMNNMNLERIHLIQQSGKVDLSMIYLNL